MAKGFMTRRGKSKGAITNYLYNVGDECISLTGGWKVGFSAYTGLQSKELDHLYLEVTKSSSGNSFRTYVTTNKVDLTAIGVLYMYVDFVRNSSLGSVQLRVGNNSDGSTPIATKYLETSTGVYTLDLDVSSLTGEYYIIVQSSINTSAGSGSYVKSKIYNVWGEQ